MSHSEYERKHPLMVEHTIQVDGVKNAGKQKVVGFHRGLNVNMLKIKMINFYPPFFFHGIFLNHGPMAF